MSIRWHVAHHALLAENFFQSEAFLYIVKKCMVDTVTAFVITSARIKEAFYFPEQYKRT